MSIFFIAWGRIAILTGAMLFTSAAITKASAGLLESIASDEVSLICIVKEIKYAVDHSLVNDQSYTTIIPKDASQLSVYFNKRNRLTAITIDQETKSMNELLWMSNETIQLGNDNDTIIIDRKTLNFVANQRSVLEHFFKGKPFRVKGNLYGTCQTYNPNNKI